MENLLVLVITIIFYILAVWQDKREGSFYDFFIMAIVMRILWELIKLN